MLFLIHGDEGADLLDGPEAVNMPALELEFKAHVAAKLVELGVPPNEPNPWPPTSKEGISWAREWSDRVMRPWQDKVAKVYDAKFADWLVSKGWTKVPVIVHEVAR